MREVEVGANVLLREDDPSDDPGVEYPDPPRPEPAGDVPQAADDADPVDAGVVIDEAEQ